MYLPRAFESTPAATRDLMLAHPFATVIAQDEIVHVPLLVVEGESLRLRSHVARANPFAKLVTAASEVTAIFHGPDAYVSPMSYAEPHEQVPTWNYAVVHVRGRLRALDDSATVDVLRAMTNRFEAGTARWSPDLLRPEFFANLRRALVAFEIDVTDVRAKLKLSQNRSPDDRRRVETALAASPAHRDREVADLMKRTTERS